jgi:hypothetical protein
MMTKRCYAMALKQLRTGFIDNKRQVHCLKLKRLLQFLISIVSNPNDRDKDLLLNKYWNLVMFESPSDAVKNIEEKM